MFHLYSPQGRVFTGTLEQLRGLPAVPGATRVRRVQAVGEGQGTASPVAAAGAQAAGAGAYEAVAQTEGRHRLTRVADVMRQPAHTVRAGTALREAWALLARHGIGQAPVVDAAGVVVGLVARAELLPAAWFGDAPPDPRRWAAMLGRAVDELMWQPVPATGPDTDLRRVAELLLATGLPGLPVTDDDGRVLGFVSRTDLLRPLAVDPTLDLWG